MFEQPDVLSQILLCPIEPPGIDIADGGQLSVGDDPVDDLPGVTRSPVSDADHADSYVVHSSPPMRWRQRIWSSGKGARHRWKRKKPLAPLGRRPRLLSFSEQRLAGEAQGRRICLQGGTDFVARFTRHSTAQRVRPESVAEPFEQAL